MYDDECASKSTSNREGTEDPTSDGGLNGSAIENIRYS